VTTSTSYETSADAGALPEPPSLGKGDSVVSLRDTSCALPATPLITIRPSKPWSSLDLHSLWSYRELLYFLMWRDIKVRYKQTLLGAAWAILQPLVMMIVFTFFFSKLARIPTEGIPSAPFYYTGLVAWMFFSNAAISGANSLLGNTNLITKVYFPKMIIPSAAVCSGLVDLAVASALLLLLLIYYGFVFTWNLLLLAPLSILLTALALAVGILFSALNTKYRDVRYALPFLLQVWMFVSPIIYPLSLVPEQWRWMISLNPMTAIIEGFRASLFGRAPNWWGLAYSLVCSLVLLVVAAYLFRRMERSFAEVI